MDILFIILIVIILILIIKINYIKNNKIHFETFSNKIDFGKYLLDEYHIPYTQTKIRPDCIFVSLASYRDKECSETIKQLFTKAKNPNKIFLGICQQNDLNDPTCLCNNYSSNIRRIDIEHTDARGPTWARYLASHLWDGEEYFLQIDSHLHFIQDWDIKLKNMLDKCPSGKAILTHYPPDYNRNGTIEDHPQIKDNKKITYTCSAHYENNNIISEAKVIDKFNNYPMITPYASAGLLFGKSTFLKEVPFDPYLPHLFQGEEILLATRLWTHGWDLYNLSEPICTHNYGRESSPHYWNDQQHIYKTLETESHKRYRYIIGTLDKQSVHPLFLKHIDSYGLGNIRSLNDYSHFSGIDFKNKKIISRCKQQYDIEKQQWI